MAADACFPQVAIKVESSSARNPKLFHEAKCYAALAGNPGIPAVHWSGVADLAVGDLPRGEYNVRRRFGRALGGRASGVRRSSKGLKVADDEV